MQKPTQSPLTPNHHRRLPSRTMLICLVSFTLLLLGAAFGLVAAWPPAAAGLLPHRDQEQTSPIGLVVDAAGGTADAALAPPTREALPDTNPTADEPASFEALIESLVTLGIHTAELAQQDDIDAAKASDQSARQLFADLMRRFDDAGERSLAQLAGMPEPPVDPRDPPRRTVLQLVLTAELARRHDTANAAADRSRIDPLVQSLLDVMPQTRPLGELGGDVLADRPYLRLVHEPGVLGLVRMAGEDAFPRQVATRLLLTLWDNLQKTGERSSAELCQLAMLMLADGDPSHRTAACRQLLADPRYRSVVLSWLRQHNDVAVAGEVAGLAARELAPSEALAVLRELAPLLPTAPGAYAVLGYRAPEVLADAYQSLLADNTQPGIRRQLIAGVGMNPAEVGIAIAQFALQNDPALEVRLQAVFALTAKSHAEVGERALGQILDDPAVAQSPTHLGAMVLALQNLESSGDANAIDRIGQRLRAMPLSVASQQALEALLARSLPGGQSSRPGAGGASQVTGAGQATQGQAANEPARRGRL